LWQRAYSPRRSFRYVRRKRDTSSQRKREYGTGVLAGTGFLRYQHTCVSFYDFLLAYIFPENIWRVFPVTVIENRKIICVVPGSKTSRFEQYREAWNLMQLPSTEPGASPTG